METKKEIIKTHIYLVLFNISTRKPFTKYFETEHEKDKFKNKLRFSKKLIVVRDSNEDRYLD